MPTKYIFPATVLKVEERFRKDVSMGWWVTLSGSRNSQFFGMAPIDLKVGDAVETTVMKRPGEEPAPPIVVEPKPPASPPERVEMQAAAFAMAGAEAPYPKELQRVEARAMGFEGDPCNDCGHFTLVRNGTCLKCNTCGSTTGCS